jgi:ribose transport system substrate-binding protein
MNSLVSEYGAGVLCSHFEILCVWVVPVKRNWWRRLKRRRIPILLSLVLPTCVVGLLLFFRHRQPPVIAVIPRTCGTYLWEAEHTGVARMAPAYGLKVYWNGPMREDDIQGQIDILTEALDRGMRGVIISPIAALPLRVPVHKAVERGVPVVVVGTDLGLAPGKDLAYVVNDEERGGQMAARRIGKRLKGHGAVAILGINRELTSTAERALSVERTFAGEFPGITVVFRSLALPTVSQEQQVAEKMLVEGGHIDGIVALTEASTRGAFYALTEFNRTTTTPLVGFDQNLLAPIRTGEIDSVVIQDTDQMGRDAMQLMNEEIHGGANQARVVVEPKLVTKQTIDSPAIQKILILSWYKQ